MARQTTIVKLGYQYFAVNSPTAAAKVIELIGKLQPVERDYDDDGDYYHPEERNGRTETGIKFNQRLETKKRVRPSLPAPVPGSTACAHCDCTVPPGKPCPGCGMPAASPADH